VVEHEDRRDGDTECGERRLPANAAREEKLFVLELH
jgi:hypothetical protein